MIEKSKVKGFTLIELLVVIAIIALLSSVVLASLNTARAKARDTKRIADLTQVRNALEAYYSDHGKYPRGNASSGSYQIETDLAPLVSGGYISKIPRDPIASNYYYYYTGGDGSTSGWLCGGFRRTNYKYSLVFKLENSSDLFPKVSNTPVGTHCILGSPK